MRSAVALGSFDSSSASASAGGICKGVSRTSGAGAAACVPAACAPAGAAAGFGAAAAGLATIVPDGAGRAGVFAVAVAAGALDGVVEPPEPAAPVVVTI